jgi:ribonuclease inhibitor
MAVEEITIDVGFASSRQSLHETLAAVLGFPGYYGMNWDAFWDCVRDFEQSAMPRHLILNGMSHLDERLPDDARKLRGIISDLTRVRPDIKVTVYD